MSKRGETQRDADGQANRPETKQEALGLERYGELDLESLGEFARKIDINTDDNDWAEQLKSKIKGTKETRPHIYNIARGFGMEAFARELFEWADADPGGQARS